MPSAAALASFELPRWFPAVVSDGWGKEKGSRLRMKELLKTRFRNASGIQNAATRKLLR